MGQTSNLGPQVPREPRRGQSGSTWPGAAQGQTQVETCRTEQGRTTRAETRTGWEGLQTEHGQGAEMKGTAGAGLTEARGSW